MEKINPETPDLTQENIDKIAELFPDVMTEVQDVDGNIVRAIDFDALKGDLSGEVVEGKRERYQFTWPGKSAAKLEARTPCDKTMRPHPEESVNWDTTQNLYIEGDNLESLKIMRETYAGTVKLIYIDPPYNTGNDSFVYPDDYRQGQEEYNEIDGQLDYEGNRLVDNKESFGRFHSVWCSMMYQRLLLARDLLSSTGVIAVSIDDNEVAALRFLCDEIFGRYNFEGHIHWRRRHNQPNDGTKMIGLVAEHILVYAKDSKALRDSGVGKIDITGKFSNPDNDPRGAWASKPWKVGSNQSGSNYQIVSPTGKVFNEAWMGEKETFNSLLAEGRIIFPNNGEGFPRKKYYQAERKEEGQCATNWWSHEDFGHNQGANDCMTELFDGRKNLFSNPKPVELVRGLIQIANVCEDDIVMDFFSGSSTTAHAVMSINNEDLLKRRFIMVQIPDNLDEAIQRATGKSKEQMQNAIDFLNEIHRPHTLCEIGKERIRRAGAKMTAEIEETNRQLKIGENLKPVPDIGFRVLKIDSSNYQDTYGEPDAFVQDSLNLYVDNLKTNRTVEDLLFQVMPKFRIPYSATIDKIDLCGKEVFDVNSGQLLACFDANVGVDTIEAIAKRKPVYAVLRDASLVDDSTAANFEELFKTFSPDTIRRVI